MKSVKNAFFVSINFNETVRFSRGFTKTQSKQKFTKKAEKCIFFVRSQPDYDNDDDGPRQNWPTVCALITYF